MRAVRFVSVVGLFLVMSGCGDDGSTTLDGSVAPDGGADTSQPAEGGPGAEGGPLPDGGGGDTAPPLVDGCANAAALRTSCDGTLATRFDTSTTLPKGCYRAASTPVLGATVTLTLAPGVTIIFAKDAGLDLSTDQVLVAQGTAAEPICLTGATATRGAWNGLSYDMTNSDANVLNYVTVEYGGDTTHDSTAAGIKVTSDSRGASFSMSHSIVRESQGYGLSLIGSSRVAAFAGNVITRNTLGPADLDAEIVRVLDGASTYAGNDKDQVHVRSVRVDTAATWAAIDVPYYLKSGLQLAIVLTVTAPATFIMGADAEIEVIGANGSDGGFSAVGTADKPILFTGEQKVRGHWNGISFTNSNNAANKLVYATVEYAGKLIDGNVVVGSTGFETKVTMAHCTIRESLGYGMKTDANSVLPAFDANTFTKNAKGPVWADSKKVHQFLPTSTYTGNDVDEVGVYTNRVETATWSDLGVPFRLDGIGRLHVDGVWTMAPGVVLIMAQDGWIENGCDDVCAINAVGTAANPIVITGAEKTRGYWQAIKFGGSSNSSNVLDYVTVEYGGQTAVDPAEITALTDSRGYVISITHSTIQHSGGGGIALSGGVNAHWNADIATSNTFADNAGTNVIFPL
jgi:hypothetical protein